jgi:hypothetical protein
MKGQSGGEAAFPPASAIGAFIGLHGQKWLRFNDYRSLNFNMMLKIEFKKIHNDNGLIKDIKGYRSHFFRLLTHLLRKVMTVIYFPPLLLLVDYPI